MTIIQKQKAIEFLEIVTEVEPDEIESCEDYELEAWLYGNGYRLGWQRIDATGI